MWDVPTSPLSITHLGPLNTYGEWPPNLFIQSLIIKVSCMNSPLQARTGEREIVLSVILTSRVFVSGEGKRGGLWTTWSQSCAFAKSSFISGEAFVKKAPLNHRCVIQVHLLRLAFPLWPRAAGGTCGGVESAIFYCFRVIYMGGPLGQEV